METLYDLHREHNELESDIKFYLDEISFLMKILTKEYLVHTESSKVKLLDSYWDEFEKFRTQLVKLGGEITNHEKNLANIYQGKSDELKKNSLSETKIIVEFINIVDGLKTIKESFYAFRMVHGEN